MNENDKDRKTNNSSDENNRLATNDNLNHDPADKPKSDGSEFFHHTKENDLSNVNGATNDNFPNINTSNNIQNMTNNSYNPNTLDNNYKNANNDTLNKRKNKNNNSSDSLTKPNNDLDKDNKDSFSKKDNDDSNKNKHDAKDDRADIKKSKSTLLSNTQRKASNLGPNTIDDDYEKSEGERTVDKAGEKLAQAGDTVLSLANDGIKAVWAVLPVTAKLAISALAIIILVIAFILFLLLAQTSINSNAAKTLTNAVVTYDNRSLDINDYIKGTLYNLYKENDEYDTDNKEFIRAYSIYIRSIIYDSYRKNNEFNANSLPELKYDESYKKLKEKNDNNNGELTVSNLINPKTDIISLLEVELNDNSLIDIANTNTKEDEFDISIFNIVDETKRSYIEYPKAFSINVIHDMYNKSKSGTNYTDVLKSVYESSKDFKIQEYLNDMSSVGTIIACSNCDFMNPMCSRGWTTYNNHNAADIPAPLGTPARASADGTVIQIGRHSANYYPGTMPVCNTLQSYGNFILVDHGNGTRTRYAHLSNILVSEGARVSQGQVIGEVGSTGCSSGPHLHFEIIINGIRTPEPWIYFTNVAC